jgi:hypothetical protein
MSFKRFILLFLFLCTFAKSHSQDTCITAGDATLYHYTDVNPDEYLTSCCYQPPDSFNLDLDHDGTIDFYLVSWYRNFMGGSYGWSYIQGAGNNKILVNSVNNAIPDTLSIGDTICGGGTWANKGYFVDWYSIFGDSASYYNYNQWQDLMNRYVGLAVNDAVDSVYGWVGVQSSGSATSGSSTVLVIRDYGCGYKIPVPVPPPASGPDPASAAALSGTVFFPNPTTDIVNINLPAYAEYEVKLVNSLGQIVYRNYGSQKLIDMRAFDPGAYTLIVITSDSSIRERIIRVKENK